MEEMLLLREQMKNATEQSNYKDKTLVYGEGCLQAKIFMIGEAPGGDEEKQGHPFVGKAGKNLNEFLEVVGLKRDEIYISNVVKLRPTQLSPKTGNPVNRTPTKEEIKFFLPFLKKEIEIVSPHIIVTLGNVPLRAVLGDESASIGTYHGTLALVKEQKVFPLYHPAAIIYNNALKETYNSDLCVLKGLLN